MGKKLAVRDKNNNTNDNDHDDDNNVWMKVTISVQKIRNNYVQWFYFLLFFFYFDFFISFKAKPRPLSPMA